MSDSTSERNEQLKATMSQKETPLNKGPGQVPCGQPQVKNVSKYTSRNGHPYGDK
jgi:hypothetical protein